MSVKRTSPTPIAQRQRSPMPDLQRAPDETELDEPSVDEAVESLDALAGGGSHGSAGVALQRRVVDRLQHTHGNRFVNRLLQRSLAIQREEGDIVQSTGDLNELMAKQLQLRNHHPSTNIGIFNADYTPATGNLAIVSKLFFDFQNGNPADPDFVTTVGGPAAAAAFTPDQFTWTPEEQTSWSDNALTTIESVWSGRHSFHCTTAWFEALPNAMVNVDVQTTARREDAHYVIVVNKWPTEPGRSEFMNDPADRSTHQSTGELNESGDNGGIEDPDSSHFVRNTGTRARYGAVDTANPGQVFFDVNSSELRPGDLAAVQNLGQTLGQPDIPPFEVTVTGHASADGQIDPNRVLSEDRARSVSNELVTSGAKRQPTVVAAGEDGAEATPDWRRANIEIGNFESDQRTVAHEFGHIIGLDDEYPAADGSASRTVGTEVGHSDLAENLLPGQQPVVAHHNENIMSNGEVVRPHHYVTFLEALNKMTGDRLQWEVGPGRGPTGPGDFPTPTDTDTQTA